MARLPQFTIKQLFYITAIAAIVSSFAWRITFDEAILLFGALALLLGVVLVVTAPFYKPSWPEPKRRAKWGLMLIIAAVVWLWFLMPRTN
jgi:hypothetical protein